MLTGAQLRAARMSLRLTVHDLARSSAVSVSTIKRAEADDGVPSISARNMLTLKTALEAAGIEFIGSPDDAPGIRIHRR